MKNLKFVLMAFTVALIGMNGFGAEHRTLKSLAEDHTVVVLPVQSDIQADLVQYFATDPFVMAQVSFATLTESFTFAAPKFIALTEAYEQLIINYDEPERNYKSYSTASINKEVKSRKLFPKWNQEHIQKYSGYRC